MSAPHQWWQVNIEPPARAPRAPEEPEEEYEQQNLRLLGLMAVNQDPYFGYFEHWYLQWTYMQLTRNWPYIMCEPSSHGMTLWADIFECLELDRKSQMDLLLLAHLGLAGRSEANKILWDLLSYWGLDRRYRDLSHKASSLVNQSRRKLDRPPKNHRDRGWWTWSAYNVPRPEVFEFSPMAAPTGSCSTPVLGLDGVPQPPPRCWGTKALPSSEIQWRHRQILEKGRYLEFY